MTARNEHDGLIRGGLWITGLALVGLGGVFAKRSSGPRRSGGRDRPQKILYVHAPAATMSLMAFSLVGVASCGLPLLQGPAARRVCRGVGGGRTGLRRDDADHRPALGPAGMGHVVAMGAPADLDPLAGAFVCWLPDDADRHRGPGRPGPVQCGGRDHGAGLGAVRPSERLSLSGPFIPSPSIFKPSAPSFPWEMLRTFLMSMVVYFGLYIGFVTTRYGLGRRSGEALMNTPDNGGYLVAAYRSWPRHGWLCGQSLPPVSGGEVTGLSRRWVEATAAIRSKCPD